MKWIEPGLISAPDEITNAYGSSILLGEQLARRGITSLEDAQAFLDPQAYTQSSPFAFKDMRKAIARINQAIQNKERIGIWGDFDVDGQTSTALLLDGLRRAGAQVSFHIPNRARESHGIRMEFLKEFMTTGLALLITCDTGITEVESLQYACDQGLDVILTDHHSPAEQLPPALAIINPHLLTEGHPMKNLAGVGAAYQVIRGLYETNGLAESAQSYLDLVALGTIADLAELSHENRFYAQMGLRQMNSSLRPSLDAILTTAGFPNNTITESMIGFTIAPRLNAVGRLDDANINVEFLLSEDGAFLEQTTGKLETSNAQRKIAVDMVYQSASEMLQKEPDLSRFSALVLAQAGWEKGVVGIAASKLAEEHNKPVILLNIQDDIAAGSVRSIEGIDIIHAIRANGTFLNSFGGHPMAAGLSLNMDRLREFRAALSRTIEKTYKEIPAEKQIQIDGYLTFANLNMDLVNEINSLAPFGSGNPPPVLVSRDLEINKVVAIGKNDLHRKLSIQNEAGETQDALWWNANGQPLPQGRFDLAYYLRLNEFRGQREIVLEWIDWQEHKPEVIDIGTPLYTTDVQDFRLSPLAAAMARKLAEEPDVCFWAEGLDKVINISTQNRLALKKAATLAVLTPPPSLSILQNALRIVKPAQVSLFRLNPADDSFDGFLGKLSGLLKFAISHYEGKIEPAKLAAVLGQTETLIELGLNWWTAHGDVAVSRTNPEEYQIENIKTSATIDQQALTSISQVLQAALNESAAFRSYYTRADPAFLLRRISGK